MGVYSSGLSSGRTVVKMAATVCWSHCTSRIISVSLPYHDCRRDNGNHSYCDSRRSAWIQAHERIRTTATKHTLMKLMPKEVVRMYMNIQTYRQLLTACVPGNKWLAAKYEGDSCAGWRRHKAETAKTINSLTHWVSCELIAYSSHTQPWPLLVQYIFTVWLLPYTVKGTQYLFRPEALAGASTRWLCYEDCIW